MKTQNVAVINAPVTVVRDAAQLVPLLSFGDNGSVSLLKGSEMTPDDVATLAIDYAKKAQSAGLYAANILRLAKGMPEVTVTTGAKLKDGGDVTRKVSAFQYACDKVRESLATDSAWYNVKGLIEASEVVDANNLKASPFAVKETLGYLRAAGAFKKDGESVTQKLLGHDKVVKALKDGIGVNKVREVVAKAKESKPEVFPPAKKKGEKLPDAPVIGGKVLTAAEVVREIQSCIGLWDKAIAQGVSVAEMRAAALEDVSKLIKLAGL